MNTKFMGRLGLSDEEESALVSFLQTSPTAIFSG